MPLEWKFMVCFHALQICRVEVYGLSLQICRVEVYGLSLQICRVEVYGLCAIAQPA